MYAENNLKYVVVISRTVPVWKSYNIVAHLANALARLMRGREDLAFIRYVGASGTHYGDFPVHPYVVLEAKSGTKIRNVAARVREASLPIVSIIDPMIGHSTQEQVRAAKETPEDSAEYVGIAFYGDAATIDDLTKSLSALRVPATLNEVVKLVKTATLAQPEAATA